MSIDRTAKERAWDDGYAHAATRSKQQVADLKTENERLRAALRKARKDLNDADLGEGLEFNMRWIARDLDAALTDTPDHSPGLQGREPEET